MLGSRLTFLTVTAPVASIGDHDHAFTRMPEARRREALAYLDEEATEALAAASLAAKKAIVAADTLMVESDQPHETIIATAKSKGADLILMASHGRRGVKALLLGSVTQSY